MSMKEIQLTLKTVMHHTTTSALLLLFRNIIGYNVYNAIDCGHLNSQLRTGRFKGVSGIRHVDSPPIKMIGIVNSHGLGIILASKPENNSWVTRAANPFDISRGNIGNLTAHATCIKLGPLLPATLDTEEVSMN